MPRPTASGGGEPGDGGGGGGGGGGGRLGISTDDERDMLLVLPDRPHYERLPGPFYLQQQKILEAEKAPLSRAVFGRIFC